MGEDISEHEIIWGYSLGKTEARMPMYKHPEYNLKATEEITTLKI